MTSKNIDEIKVLKAAQTLIKDEDFKGLKTLLEENFPGTFNPIRPGKKVGEKLGGNILMTILMFYTDKSSPTQNSESEVTLPLVYDYKMDNNLTKITEQLVRQGVIKQEHKKYIERHAKQLKPVITIITNANNVAIASRPLQQMQKHLQYKAKMVSDTTKAKVAKVRDSVSNRAAKASTTLQFMKNKALNKVLGNSKGRKGSFSSTNSSASTNTSSQPSTPKGKGKKSGW